MNILVIDSSPPCDLLQGNSLIGHHLFRRLSERHRLTLVCPCHPDKMETARRELSDVFDSVQLISRHSRVPTLTGVFEPALARGNVSFGGRVDLPAVRRLLACVDSLVVHTDFDIIHTRLLPMSSVVFGIDHPRKLLELVDSETLRCRRGAGINRVKLWSRTAAARLLESAAVRRFHACTTVSHADTAVIRRLAPGLPVRTIANGVDTDFFAPRNVAEETDTIVFTGAMTFPPNIAAALHFYRRIFPLIRGQIKGARFIIAGRDPVPEIRRLAADPMVTVTGFVDDIRTVIGKSAVYVCPMISGSGIKNKVLEAMAIGRPVVSTPLGVEALDVSDGCDLRVADSPEEFANAVVSLLRDPSVRTRLGKAGRKRVVDGYSWDSCAASYDDLYMEMVNRQYAWGDEKCPQIA